METHPVDIPPALLLLQKIFHHNYILFIIVQSNVYLFDSISLQTEAICLSEASGSLTTYFVETQKKNVA